ncbi:hypothetical protein PLESTB_000207200 [Pleodorina starrii]|uniref:Uncharacterized protein n=1 Tax=Pleodorina starrii TaxID=330485 RepID=A0A9W6BCQ3_9CHLO|nr:hypothetical protein PLESTM_000324300 [Pleodorina starrii]GLC49328.1 hypothetical protein PLESTB_000207200 [Pleodorina starrii]GLC73415.1 hypothetical protein PLESTF_001373000 [Pleodorina starrii]
MASSSIVMGLTALVFCTWAVSLAGIASVQQQCTSDWSSLLSGINGFTTGLPCMSFFRYYWFIIVIEFCLIVGLGVALASGAYAKTRLSWLGLFSVATLLYIQTADTFLSMDSLAADWEGSIKHRVRTMIAGSIMTATVNCMVIVALGMVPEEEAAPAPVADKTAAAV